MSEILVFVLTVILCSAGLNTCRGLWPSNISPVVPYNITYVMAPRDTFNRHYVINPYNPNERLYVGDSPEGTLKTDPMGRTYVVGP
jgi:hypothetical protein